MYQSDYDYKCPMEVTLDLIGGKWKALILWHLVDGTLRFSALKRRIPQATAKMLTQQLRDLECDLLIRRDVFPVVPPRVEYSLTPLGRCLIPVLRTMCDWGNCYIEKRTTEAKAENS